MSFLGARELNWGLEWNFEVIEVMSFGKNGRVALLNFGRFLRVVRNLFIYYCFTKHVAGEGFFKYCLSTKYSAYALRSL